MIQIIPASSASTAPTSTTDTAFVVEFDPNGGIEYAIVDGIIRGRATNSDEIGVIKSCVDICHPDVGKLGFEIIDVSFDEVPKVRFLDLFHFRGF